jgi:hypothetical protein
MLVIEEKQKRKAVHDIILSREKLNKYTQYMHRVVFILGLDMIALTSSDWL